MYMYMYMCMYMYMHMYMCMCMSALICSGLFRSALVCSGLLRTAPDSSGLLRFALVCSGLLWSADKNRRRTKTDGEQQTAKQFRRTHNGEEHTANTIPANNNTVKTTR